MKKQITIEIDDDTINGLNNSIAAFSEICVSAILGCEVPTQFQFLKEKSSDEIRARWNAVKNLYKDVEKKYFN